jgi:hypothetical protein
VAPAERTQAPALGELGRGRRDAFALPAEPTSKPEPRVIQISIGRIEIRASTAVPPRPRAADPGTRAQSLDEYLRQSAG